jgi:hypothetical protein
MSGRWRSPLPGGRGLGSFENARFSTIRGAAARHEWVRANGRARSLPGLVAILGTGAMNRAPTPAGQGHGSPRATAPISLSLAGEGRGEGERPSAIAAGPRRDPRDWRDESRPYASRTRPRIARPRRLSDLPLLGGRGPGSFENARFSTIRGAAARHEWVRANPSLRPSPAPARRSGLDARAPGGELRAIAATGAQRSSQTLS